MVIDLASLFPGLVTSGFRITSPQEMKYNCIAWAVGDPTRWWWPDLIPAPTDVGRHWPPQVPREETVDAFSAAFHTLGFVPCSDHQQQVGLEKIALFASDDGTVTHAARQLPSGLWTSKLGILEDIEHTLHALEGDEYGKVVQIFQRPSPSRTEYAQ